MRESVHERGAAAAGTERPGEQRLLKTAAVVSNRPPARSGQRGGAALTAAERVLAGVDAAVHGLAVEFAGDVELPHLLFVRVDNCLGAQSGGSEEGGGKVCRSRARGRVLWAGRQAAALHAGAGTRPPPAKAAALKPPPPLTLTVPNSSRPMNRFFRCKGRGEKRGAGGGRISIIDSKPRRAGPALVPDAGACSAAAAGLAPVCTTSEARRPSTLLAAENRCTCG